MKHQELVRPRPCHHEARPLLERAEAALRESDQPSPNAVLEADHNRHKPQGDVVSRRPFEEH